MRRRLEDEIGEAIALLLKPVDKEDVAKLIEKDIDVSELAEEFYSNPLVRLGVSIYGREILETLDGVDEDEIVEAALSALKKERPDLYEVMNTYEGRSWLRRGIRDFRHWLASKI